LSPYPEVAEMKTLLICLYGETCAGKSTLGKNLEILQGWRYISFGDLKREEIKTGSILGRKLQSLLEKECPIPAEVGYEVIGDHIQFGNINVISGYPISEDELRTVSRYGTIWKMVGLSIDEKTLISRFANRRVCPFCHQPGVEGDICPKHQVVMGRRDDVGVDELLRRRRLYRQRIEPFLASDIAQTIPTLHLDTSNLSSEVVASQVVEWINHRPDLEEVNHEL